MSIQTAPVQYGAGDSMMRARSGVWLSLSITIAFAALQAQTPPYDLIIRNARVVDGTGSPWYRAEIGIRGDEIALIASRIDGEARRLIDAAGNVVAPGFIDIHVHASGGPGQPPPLLPIIEMPT